MNTEKIKQQIKELDTDTIIYSVKDLKKINTTLYDLYKFKINDVALLYYHKEHQLIVDKKIYSDIEYIKSVLALLQFIYDNKDKIKAIIKECIENE